MTRLFVYGSLKCGGPAHALLRGAPFVDTRVIRGISLYDLGTFPGAVLAPSSFVVGEVYHDVTPEALRDIDFYEGHPRFFERITLGDVNLYVYPKSRLMRSDTLIETGEWNFV